MPYVVRSVKVLLLGEEVASPVSDSKPSKAPYLLGNMPRLLNA
jgi:hypothetical protein